MFGVKTSNLGRGMCFGRYICQRAWSINDLVFQRNGLVESRELWFAGGCEWRIFVHAVVEFDSAVCVREVLLRLKGTFKALTLFDSEGATELDLQISKSKYSPKSLPLAQGRRISDFQ